MYKKFFKKFHKSGDLKLFKCIQLMIPLFFYLGSPPMFKEGLHEQCPQKHL